MSKEITITLPDGSQKQAPVGISGLEIANMIGAGLAKAAVAFSVMASKEILVMLLVRMQISLFLQLIQMKALEIMRHTVAAQVLSPRYKKPLSKS